MCSKCYRDHTKSVQQVQAAVKPAEVKVPETSERASEVAGPSAAAVETAPAVVEEAQPAQANPSRCFCWCAFGRGARGVVISSGDARARAGDHPAGLRTRDWC